MIKIKNARDWLKEARLSKNMSQKFVAENIGIARSVYTRYELGIRTPKPEIAKKIADLLGVEKEKFFWN